RRPAAGRDPELHDIRGRGCGGRKARRRGACADQAADRCRGRERAQGARDGASTVLMTPHTELSTIPLREVREGGPVRHAIEARERARGLRDECLSWLPAVARGMVPLFDAVTRRWLM